MVDESEYEAGAAVCVCFSADVSDVRFSGVVSNVCFFCDADVIKVLADEDYNLHLAVGVGEAFLYELQLFLVK